MFTHSSVNAPIIRMVIPSLQAVIWISFSSSVSLSSDAKSIEGKHFRKR